MHIAVLGLGLAAGRSHITGMHALECAQRLAHHRLDGGVLFGHGLLKTERVNMQRHLLHIVTCAKAQQRQHQADAQIIVGTERRTLAVPQGDPLAGQDLHGTVPRFRRMVDAQCQ